MAVAPVTPDQVARALAPTIYLHSQDPHRPASVEWYLGRCQLVRGSGTVSSGHMDLPSGMSIIDQGPLTAASLKARQSTGARGDQSHTDQVTLFPLPAAPGTAPVVSWAWGPLLQGYMTAIGVPLPEEPASLSVSDPTFYNYQLLTLLGADHGATGAPIYCRIATREGYYLISYFAFFPYNGGLGPETAFDSRPLGSRSGFEAHIGDWTRLTAKVRITGSLVSLDWVDYEAHGDRQVTTIGAFSNLSLDQITPIVAYAAWHSHEFYCNNGEGGWHIRKFGFANDHTDDDGPVWNTAQTLKFISDNSPDWVSYNGRWGAHITVPSSSIVSLIDVMGGGPQGPAFHWYWTHEDKDQTKPIAQWPQAPVPEGARVRLVDTGAIYLMLDGKLRHVPTADTVNALFENWYTIRGIYTLDGLSVGAPLPADAFLSRGIGGKVYLVADGLKRWITHPEAFAKYGFSDPKVRSGEPTQPTGPDITGTPAPAVQPESIDGQRLHLNSTGQIFLALDGMLRWIPDPATYDNLFKDWSSVRSITDISGYTLGMPLNKGAYLGSTDTNQTVFLVVDGMKRRVPSSEIFERFAFNAAKIRPHLVTELGALSEGRALGLPAPPLATNSGERLRVDSDGRIYWILGGVARYIPNPETYINLFKDWSSARTVTDIAGYIVSAPLSTGAYLAKGTPDGKVYLVADGTKRWITSPQVFDRHGLNWTRIKAKPAATLNAIPNGLDIY
ncbi:MAG: hypothetical protein HQL42_06480 [Alphaproteobacteria bacterium]|nr:hypothetical protein [Alphaproteobacteria bacterium]